MAWGRKVLATTALAMALLAAGCGPTAYKVTPIPASEKLVETTVAGDPGLVLNKIAIVDLEGMIVNVTKSGLLAEENPTALVTEKLRKAAADPLVKAVVVRINSPGGGVTASDIIYREVLKVREGEPGRRPGKPVIAMILDVGASGAYYVACGTQEIMAQPTSVTGSIGVVMITLNFKGLMDKIGVGSDTIKSGPLKDAGSPLRPLEPQERKVFQTLIDEFQGGFLDVVAKSREKLTRARIQELADGRVWSGRQAEALGLVDRLGGMDDAVARAKELAGIKAAKVILYHRPVGYRGSIYSEADVPPAARTNQYNLVNLTLPDLYAGGPGSAFMYLWLP